MPSYDDVGTEVICSKCKKGIEWDGDKWTVEVKPCIECMTDKYNEGYVAGYEAGYLDAEAVAEGFTREPEKGGDEHGT